MSVEMVLYDEFSMFHENASEFGLPYDGPPVVRRERADLADGRHISALVWGDSPAELVFLHGGAQNAHTWDTVALALGRPLVCLDLPGHGHSGAGAGSTDVFGNAGDIAAAVQALAPEASAGGRNVAWGHDLVGLGRSCPGTGPQGRFGGCDPGCG